MLRLPLQVRERLKGQPCKMTSALSNVEARVTKTFVPPKVMICNVSQKEGKDDVIEDLIAGNSVHDEIQFIFTKPTGTHS